MHIHDCVAIFTRRTSFGASLFRLPGEFPLISVCINVCSMITDYWYLRASNYWSASWTACCSRLPSLSTNGNFRKTSPSRKQTIPFACHTSSLKLTILRTVRLSWKGSNHCQSSLRSYPSTCLPTYLLHKETTPPLFISSLLSLHCYSRIRPLEYQDICWPNLVVKPGFLEKSKGPFGPDEDYQDG